MNPNPLDLPVSGFFITTQSTTSPYWLKYRNKLSRVVSQLKPPMNIFLKPKEKSHQMQIYAMSQAAWGWGTASISSWPQVSRQPYTSTLFLEMCSYPCSFELSPPSFPGNFCWEVIFGLYVNNNKWIFSVPRQGESRSNLIALGYAWKWPAFQSLRRCHYITSPKERFYDFDDLRDDF